MHFESFDPEITFDFFYRYVNERYHSRHAMVIEKVESNIKTKHNSEKTIFQSRLPHWQILYVTHD